MLDNNNAQSEYYLPDVLSLMIKDGGKIGLEKTKNIVEIQGVNTLEQLSNLESIFEKNN
jgi:bifunctional UDP-N-acetylglucosamine pyrophosphorylase/glucosamine-1-phosphate N-acetyltransferase